ncbi:hypothetical protein AusDCA_0047 [Desulfitobacterium sp. AusDCA]
MKFDGSQLPAGTLKNGRCIIFIATQQISTIYKNDSAYGTAIVFF